MGPRILHYSDVENAFDRPERVGRLAGTLRALRGEGSGGTEAIVVGTGDDTAPGALALERRGRQALAFFDRIEPDAETFGNHDFDYSLADTREVVTESAVPWVSANVYRDADDPDASERFAGVDPVRVVERAGERVGFVGVTDPDVPLRPGVEVSDPVAAVADAWGDCDADWLVVLAHATDGVVRDLARETPADAVLAGHVHEVVRERVDGILVVRPGENGEVVWEVELGAGSREASGENATGSVTATRHDVPDGPLDGGMADALREQLADAGLREVVATVEESVPRDRAACLRGECALGNLATDALRWVADADVAHVDSRGLRDGPPIGPEVTVADLVGIAPFAAGVFVTTVSTADLLALVEESVHPDGVHGRDGEVWTGQFAGLELERDRAAGETRVSFDGRRLGAVDDDGDRTVSEQRDLRLATNGYVVYSDEFETLDVGDARELHGMQYEAFVAYARAVDLELGLDDRLDVVGE